MSCLHKLQLRLRALFQKGKLDADMDEEMRSHIESRTLLLGAVGAYGLSRLLQGFLFEVKATDPLTFLAVSALLGFVAFLACWLPARRAAKVDPMVALRYE